MKKIITTLLLLTIILTNIICANASQLEYGIEYNNQNINKSYIETFSDVSKSHWAFNYIMEMCDRNVLAGYPNGKFYPENKITRAEFSKIMTIASGLQISIAEHQLYEDVTIDEWFAPYIEAAHSYLSGYNVNGKYYYKPNDVALREDIAVALVKLKGYSTTGYDESLIKTMFKDSYSISKNAISYVAVAVEEGLISGYDDDTFRGQQGITRAEAAALLWRAYQYGNNNKVFDTPNNIPQKEYIDKTPNNNINIEEQSKLSVESVYVEDMTIEVEEFKCLKYIVNPVKAVSNISVNVISNPDMRIIYDDEANIVYGIYPGTAVIEVVDDLSGKRDYGTITVVEKPTISAPVIDNNDNNSDIGDSNITSKLLCEIKSNINTSKYQLISYPNGVIYTDTSKIYTCDYNGNVNIVFDIENYSCGKSENPYKDENITFYSFIYNYITDEICVSLSCEHGHYLHTISDNKNIKVDYNNKLYGIYKNGDYAVTSIGNKLLRVTSNGKIIDMGNGFSNNIIMDVNGKTYGISNNGEYSNIFNAPTDSKFYSNIDLTNSHTFLSYNPNIHKSYSYKNGIVYTINMDSGYCEELFDVSKIIADDSSDIINMKRGSLTTYDGERFFYYDHNYSCLRLISIK